MSAGYRKSHILQGRFIPRNPEKYSGDSTRIFYRSGLELKFMNYLDLHGDVLQWSSEETVIPYHDPSSMNRQRRYFPDFTVMRRDAEGNVVTTMVEIKPFSQTHQPKPRAVKTKRYIEETLTYARNCAKWEAAKSYCNQRGWKFILLTENEIN